VGAVVDHVFVCCAEGAPEADALVALGLVEGSANTHPGQGTACRRFFFANAYLELFWVRDPEEAQSELAAPTRLWDRWWQRGQAASPFAVVLRPGDGDPGTAPPFPSTSYRPDYMPLGATIERASGTHLGEPEIFFLGFQRDRARLGREPIDHGPPLRDLKRVTVWTPAEPSASARAIAGTGLFDLRPGQAHLMELAFDDARRGQADLRPDLPLVLRW
jgi:glyoxalase-like protein